MLKEEAGKLHPCRTKIPRAGRADTARGAKVVSRLQERCSRRLGAETLQRESKTEGEGEEVTV